MRGSVFFKRNKKELLSILLGLLVVSVSAGQVGDVGSSYKGYPNPHCSDFEGFVVHASIDLVVTSAKCKGGHEAWISKKRSSETNQATDAMIVLDRLHIPELKAGETFSSGPYCYLHGKEVSWLAVYKWKKRKKITSANGGIRMAWIVNPATARFEPATQELLKRVVCIANEDE